MGQYLSIGLMTNIVIGKQRAQSSAKATPEEVKCALQNTYNASGIISTTFAIATKGASAKNWR
jgi:hypothetical protein